MPIVAPTPVDPAPDVPDRADRTTFPTRMYNAFVYLFGAFKTGVEALADNAYDNATEAAAAATAAETAQGLAETDATTATTQADIATAQADIATTQAGIATTQAGLAATAEANAEMAQAAAEAARDQALAAAATLVQSNRIDSNWTLADGYNALTIGPFEVGPDVTVTGNGNSHWRGI